MIRFKGTLTQIWESVYILFSVWKEYVEDFTLKHFLLFEICTRDIHSETIEYVKN